MSLNWREIDLILSELDLPGSFIQRVIQPDFSSLVLSIYRPGDPFDLYISLENGKTRLHRLADSLKTPAKLQRFAQFLRSRCKGARITEAYQVAGDRIVKLTTQATEVTTVLWIRLWGGAANVIATDEEGTILDAFYRRPARGETTGGVYRPEDSNGEQPRKSQKDYEVRELPGEGTFNERVEAFYRGGGPENRTEALRLDALAAIERRETKLLSSRENLRRQKKANENAERLKQLGDLVMSNLQKIGKDARMVAVEDYYEENRLVEIELDPTLSPEQNAESYYGRYKRAKSGFQKLADELSQLDEEIEKVKEQRREILETSDKKALEKLLRTPAKGGSSTAKTPPPGLQFVSGGHRIIVGRSANENDTLLRRHVRGNDLWLHTRDYPGSYVFVKNIPGKSIPLEVLLDAGVLALYYSKARGNGQADLYYTQVKYLRRPKEGKKGLVLPTNEKNLVVHADEKRLGRLFREQSERDFAS